MPIFVLVASCIAAYLLGSVSFAVIISKLFIKKDVRELGSGNAGMTNVMRNAGILPGLITFVFDCLKGVASALCGKLLVFPYLYEATGIEFFSNVNGALVLGCFCFIGHVFPVFFQFRGGKGVATIGGVSLAACPICFCIAIAIFLLVTLLTRMVSAGSIVAGVSLIILIYFFEASPFIPLWSVLFMAIMCVSSILKHSQNIKRIISGTENKIGKKK